MIHFIKKVGGVLPLEEIEDENESFVLSNHSSAINFVARPKRLKAKRNIAKKKLVTIPEDKMAKLKARLFEHLVI